MSRRDLLGELRAAVDAGGGAVGRFMAGLDREELEALVLALGLLDSSLRAAQAFGGAGAASTPEDRFRGEAVPVGADDPNLREYGADWQEAQVVAFTGWVRERLDDPARLLDELVGERAMPAVTARAIVGELVTAIETGELAPEPVRDAVRQVRAMLAEREPAGGAEEREPAGWDGEARALALVAVLVWADARRDGR